MTKHVIMLASENDALVGGKVGGVGDVVRDLPRALASLGWRSTVITPSYGFLQEKNNAENIGSVQFPFDGHIHTANIFLVEPKEPIDRVQHLVFDHPQILGEPIYYNDPPSSPFMRDATKYALWCSAVGKFLLTLDTPFVLHLHDWHAATLLFLRERHSDFFGLKGIHTAFTIHNLAIQGTRPLLGPVSSVEAWFPELFSRIAWIDSWKDRRYETPCYTPMAVGIQYADKVNTVSPGYADEIILSSDHRNGFFGGEGLEEILREKKHRGKLFGILNGCPYPKHHAPVQRPLYEILESIITELSKLQKTRPDHFHNEMAESARHLQQHPPSFMLTSVTRVVDQKVRLLFEHNSDGHSALDEIMSLLERHDGCYVMLGSGMKEYEQRLEAAARKHKRFLFISGYSDVVAETLYASGTIFLMPSSFEPCGISQMIAMREGQPCIVHCVGGLKDTVQNNVDGFSFTGSTVTEQVDNFIRVTESAMKKYLADKEGWSAIVRSARDARFTWEKSAAEYVANMYS